MKELLAYLPKMRGKKIGVCGDLIADEYVFGTIHRFSREAPVFIVNYEESHIAPGGAANAVNNIHDMGGVPFPFGVLGKDDAGTTLFSVLKEKGIMTEGILQNDRQSTFVKQRVVAGSPHSVKQQILRIDRCFPLGSDSEHHKELNERVQSYLDELDGFVISDYGLGVNQPSQISGILNECNKRGIPCFVDSRHNLSLYRGMTAVTPNEPEVEAMIGRPFDNKSLPEVGKELLQRMQTKAVLITRGKNGMALFSEEADPKWIPVFGSSDIVDVTGAGDTVVSTFALAVSAGASFYDAARLANCAAGLVVMKRGAATVTQEELTEAIRIAGMHS